MRTRDDSGAVLVMVAAFMTVAMAATAFAVDLGRLTDRKRELQALADLVAIDAARALQDGAPPSEQYGPVRVAAEESAARNGFLTDEIESMDVVLGQWTSETRTFLAYAADDDDPAHAPNAVRILTTDTVDYAFAPLSGRSTRLATAVRGAVIPPVPSTTTTSPGTPPPPPNQLHRASSCLTIGSFLARGEPTAGVLGALLAEYLDVTDADVVFTAVGYEGLSDVMVGLDDLRVALGLGSMDELLTSDVAVSDVVRGIATVLANDGTVAGTEVDGLVRLAGAVDAVQRVRLGDTVQVATGYEDAAATGAVDALSLLMGTAMLADGDSFVDVDLSGVVPGFATATLRATIVEPPESACGPAQVAPGGGWLTFGETSQVEAELVLGVDVPLLGRVEIPLTLSGADGTGSLTRTACPVGAPSETTLAVDTSALEVDSGPISTLAGAVLAAPSSVTVAGAYDDLDFLWDGSTDVRRESVGSDSLDLGVGSAVVGAIPVLGDVSNDVDLAVETVTSALGLRVGGADVTTTAPLCTTVQLLP